MESYGKLRNTLNKNTTIISGYNNFVRFDTSKLYSVSPFCRINLIDNIISSETQLILNNQVRVNIPLTDIIIMKTSSFILPKSNIINHFGYIYLYITELIQNFSIGLAKRYQFRYKIQDYSATHYLCEPVNERISFREPQFVNNYTMTISLFTETQDYNIEQCTYILNSNTFITGFPSTLILPNHGLIAGDIIYIKEFPYLTPDPNGYPVTIVDANTVQINFDTTGVIITVYFYTFVAKRMFSIDFTAKSVCTDVGNHIVITEQN